MTSTTLQTPISQIAFRLSKTLLSEAWLSAALVPGLIGVFLTHPAIADPLPLPESPILIATPNSIS